MADTTVRIVVDASQAQSTLKSLTKDFKDLETNAKSAAKGADETAKSLEELGKKGAGARSHLVQLIQDLAEGRSVLRTFSSQGVDLLKNTETLGAMFRSLGAAIVSPAGLLVGLGVAIGAVGYAAVKGASELNELKNQLSATNNMAGLTAGSIEVLAQSLKGGGVTGGEMREALAGLAASGRIGADGLAVTGSVIQKLSSLTEESANKIGGELTKAFNGNINTIKELNNTYHFLSAAQYEHIDNLIREGKHQQAGIETMKAMDAQLKSQTKEVGLLGQAWETTTNFFSDFWTSLKNVGKDDSSKTVAALSSSLALLKTRIAEIEAIPEGQRTPNQIRSLEKLTQARINNEKLAAEETSKINDANAAKKEQSDKNIAEQEQILRNEANKGLQYGVTLEQQKEGFARRKAALDATAAQMGDAQVASSRAQLAYEEKIATLEAERKRTNELDPLKKDTTNARIDAAEKAARTERDGAINVAGIKETIAEKEFQEQLFLHSEKIKQGYQEIDVGDIARKKTQDGILLEEMLRKRLKAIGDPNAEGTRGMALKAQVEKQKELDAAIINTTEIDKLMSGITGDLNRKLAKDTQLQTDALKDQRAILLANSPVEQKILQENITLRKEEAAEILKVQKAFGDQTKLTSEQIADQTKLTDAIKKEYQERRDAAEANLRTDQRISSSAAFGMEEALAKISRMAKTPAQQIGATMDIVFNDMGKALDNFVDTGKLSFGDFANSVIKDILKMELKEAEVGLFKALKPGVISLFGFADGGEPPVGVPSIVGENGPELFIPKSSGTIVPNHQLTVGNNTSQASGGDIYHTHNYNIQAVDAKSVAQLFAENRMTMFGMVEQARRELPMRTR